MSIAAWIVNGAQPIRDRPSAPSRKVAPRSSIGEGLGVTKKEFRKLLNTEVATLEEELLPSVDQAFAAYALQLLFDMDRDDAIEAADAATDAEGPFAAISYDSTERRVIAAAAAYSRSGDQPDDDLVSDVSDGWESLRDSRLLGVPPSEITTTRVTLALISTGEWSAKAQKLAEDAQAKLPTRVRLELFGLADLLEAEHGRASKDDFTPINEDIKVKEHFKYERPGRPAAYVAVVSGAELAELERKYRYQLFERNVRYWLGKKLVNEGIGNTLRDPAGRADFWYFNNGITMVCDSVDIDAGVATVTNVQIVNGCQTTSTLGVNRDVLVEDPSADVLVRFVATESDELKNSITRYTNKQNAVAARDLMGNDEEQAKLQRKFDKLDPPWFYERKAGAWKALTPSQRKRYNGRRIDNQRAAQAALSFFDDPGLARARKRYLFVSVDEDSNGLYERVFPPTTSTTRVLLPFRVYQYVDAQRAKYQKQLRPVQKKYEGQDLDALKKEGRVPPKDLAVLSREWIKFANEYFVGTVGWLTAQRINVSNDKQLKRLLDAPEFDDYVAAIYVVAAGNLRQYFRKTENEQQVFSAANWVKGNWDDCREALANEWYDVSELGEADPLAGVPLLAGEPDRHA